MREMPAKTYARIAGVLYLAIAVFGAFAIGYVPSVIVVAGDAAATAANVLANRALFGLGVVADVVVMLTEVVLTVMLFILFKPVSLTLSLIAMVSRLVMVAVMAVNVLINVMPLVLLGGSNYLGAFAPEQLRATSLILIEAHGYGVYVWDVFFGFHLAALGYLIFRSSYFPKLIGMAVMVGSLGYFLEGLRHVAFIDHPILGPAVVGLLVVASVSELAFAFWLLIKGPDTTIWNEKALA
jgi:hypothetical protein